MKKHLTKKQGDFDHQKSLSRKNNIILGIQITTLGIISIMIFASIYNG